MGDVVVEKILTIVNRRGLHARAAAKFVRIAETYYPAVKITVIRDDMVVGGCSIMGLLMLGAGVDTKITVRATGDRAPDVLAEIAALVENRFGETE